MYQNYFVVNDTKYYTGTVFLVKNMGREEEASFVCYDLTRKKYVYKINDCKYHMDEITFQNRFIGITDKANHEVRVPTIKTKKDTEIGGLLLGWMWYIFLMVISVIFKDAVGLWIFISIVLFSWRSRKIKEEGTYSE